MGSHVTACEWFRWLPHRVEPCARSCRARGRPDVGALGASGAAAFEGARRHRRDDRLPAVACIVSDRHDTERGASFLSGATLVRHCNIKDCGTHPKDGSRSIFDRGSGGTQDPRPKPGTGNRLAPAEHSFTRSRPVSIVDFWGVDRLAQTCRGCVKCVRQIRYYFWKCPLTCNFVRGCAFSLKMLVLRAGGMVL